jgi:uncharacterized membrane protein
MTPTHLLYLTARGLHVLFGALWVGSVFFVVFFLSPSMAEAGPDAAKVMGGLLKRRFLDIIPMIAFSNIALGLWLYWRLTGGWDPSLRGTNAAMVFGTGGLLAIVTISIGMLGMRRNTLRAIAKSREAASTPDGPGKAEAMQMAQQFRARAGKAGRVAAVLLMITIVLMALGHYV